MASSSRQIQSSKGTLSNAACAHESQLGSSTKLTRVENPSLQSCLSNCAIRSSAKSCIVESGVNCDLKTRAHWVHAPTQGKPPTLFTTQKARFGAIPALCQRRSTSRFAFSRGIAQCTGLTCGGTASVPTKVEPARRSPWFEMFDTRVSKSVV
jgi:hypothetical protein